MRIGNLCLFVLSCLVIVATPASAQVVSRFDFNDPSSIQTATVGPFATSVSPVAVAPNGVLYITSGCGAGVGADLQVPGETFNVNNITIFTRFQRWGTEYNGSFFLRDYLDFGFISRRLYATYRVTDGFGNFQTVNLTPTVLVSAAQFVEYQFFYDNCSGVGGILKAGDTIAVNDGPDNWRLAWNNGPALISSNVDNGCNSTPGMDWIEIHGNGSTCLVPLPVELGSFSGKMTPQGADLQWTVLREDNNSHFTLERSGDGLEYEEIGTVASLGNTNEARQYRWLDSDPLEGLALYRLRQTDLDGASRTFAPIRLETSVLERNFAIGPNPVRGHLQVVLPDGEREAVLEIFDLQGKQLKSFVLETASSHRIYLSGWTPGFYLARIRQGSKTHQQKILVAPN